MFSPNKLTMLCSLAGEETLMVRHQTLQLSLEIGLRVLPFNLSCIFKIVGKDILIVDE